MVQVLAFLAIAIGLAILVGTVRIIEAMQKLFRKPHRYKRRGP